MVLRVAVRCGDVSLHLDLHSAYPNVPPCCCLSHVAMVGGRLSRGEERRGDGALQHQPGHGGARPEHHLQRPPLPDLLQVATTRSIERKDVTAWALDDGRKALLGTN